MHLRLSAQRVSGEHTVSSAPIAPAEDEALAAVMDHYQTSFGPDWGRIESTAHISTDPQSDAPHVLTVDVVCLNHRWEPNSYLVWLDAAGRLVLDDLGDNPPTACCMPIIASQQQETGVPEPVRRRAELTRAIGQRLRQDAKREQLIARLRVEQVHAEEQFAREQHAASAPWWLRWVKRLGPRP